MFKVRTPCLFPGKVSEWRGQAVPTAAGKPWGSAAQEVAGDAQLLTCGWDKEQIPFPEWHLG